MGLNVQEFGGVFKQECCLFINIYLLKFGYGKHGKRVAQKIRVLRKKVGSRVAASLWSLKTKALCLICKETDTVRKD
jgi:hypothetical protein